ncbi:MAG: transposase zinc-binding domain-containing protein [Sterolibacteriaceae bacterium]|nr:transposase zinc-binding domain-containing protein [Sterolibacteriaceae bacterium]MBK9086785.1 transposase zinc-binding domain-containing protein [Sterolibacteriaceae bacterium]
MIRSLQEIFREHFPQYAKSHRLHLGELRAAHAIMDCRTRALGGHVLSCPDGHYSRTQYHSCRHRSCPRCADRPRQQWIEAQLQRLLPCAHFHVVFTLPHDFVPLWAFNRVRLSALLFDCAREPARSVQGRASPGCAARHPDGPAHLGPHAQPAPARTLPGQCRRARCAGPVAA